MIDKSNPYFKQTELLIETLPVIAQHNCYALKGGTAINLFVQDMPRISVDVDLTYLPIKERDESFSDIEKTLKVISDDIKKRVIGAFVERIRNKDIIHKLKVIRNGSEIKIEPNLVIRGTAFPCEELELSSKTQEVFEMSARIQVVSLADLYGGKICAALDRQHPRDLYDVKFLLDNDGLTEEIRKGFLVYLISHDRPIHESLNPIFKDFEEVYKNEFIGMTSEVIPYEELVEVRADLLNQIKHALTQDEKDFLISFKKGSPDWELLGVKDVDRLPAVRWKLFNIQKMDDKKRGVFVNKLREALD
ncbi:MAG: nucleotidyl transferase AbiEii/AbiGii toxin family protein [Candidatus Omnitrophota bacterium]